MTDLLHPTAQPEDESPQAQPPLDVGEFALALGARDAMEAELLVDACEEAGIPVFIQSPRSGPVGTIASPVEAWNLLVPREQLVRARALLEERRAALEADPEGAARAAEAEEESSQG